MSKVLDVAARRDAFLRLVRLQDQGCPVSASFEQVAADLKISVPQLQMIEQEGLEQEWPPLSGGAPADEPDQSADISTSSQNAASITALHDPPTNSL